MSDLEDIMRKEKYDPLEQMIITFSFGGKMHTSIAELGAGQLATYRAAIASAADILRGFALLGQDGDLKAAAEWLEKYGGLK